MLRIKTIFLLGVIITHIGCNSNGETNPVDEFENVEVRSIKGDAVHFTSDTVFNDPRDMWVRNNHLYVQDNLDGKVFSILDLQSGNLVRRFASSGSSATAFNISAVNLSMMTNNTNLTLFQANPPMRIFKYSLDSLLGPDSLYAPPYLYQFPDKLYFKDVVLLNDSLVMGQMGISDIDDNLFGLINLKTNDLVTGLKLPANKRLNTDKYFSKNFMPWTRTVMQGKFCQNPKEGNLFAYFSEKGAVTEIFKITDQHMFVSIKNRLDYLPSFEVLDYGNGTLSPVLNKECKYGFNSVTATENKIYALYNGQFIKAEGFDNLLAKTILVYSWEGEPLQKIILDIPCSAIAIDPNNPNTMYALHSYKDIGVYKYTLP